MDRKTAEARLEYWSERLIHAQKSVEVAKEQMYIAQVELGRIAVEEMIKEGTLS